MSKKAKSVYDLKIHETLKVETESKMSLKVLRVPGGWIYYRINANLGITSTFVPFSFEDKESKYNDEETEIHI